MHFRTTYESLPWLRCESGAKEHLSHLSHNNKRNTDIEQKNWKPCWVRFPGSEKLGASRNGRMERNFPVIPIFRNFRPTSRGTPKISEWNSGKCLFHSLPNPEFPEFLVQWKAPPEYPRSDATIIDKFPIHQVPTSAPKDTSHWLIDHRKLTLPLRPSLVSSHPRRFRMWRHLSSLSGKFG